MTPSRTVRGFNWSNLGVRALSAAVLAPLVLAAAYLGGWLLLLVIAVAVALLAQEWSHMSAPAATARVAVIVTAGVLAAAFTAYFGHYRIAWIVLVLSAGAAAVLARGLAVRAADAAFGALYIGGPVLALMWLRGSEPSGRLWTFTVLLVAWTADVAAFLVGNALKGPKLWPRFSPNKTWSGFIGGLIVGPLAAVLLSRFWPGGLSAPKALLVGLFAALATMAGDLWESMLKRRFGVKDSGDLIPGHGGLLDRVDGLMFALLAVAAARLAVNVGWPN